VHHPKSGESRLLQTRDHGKDALLLRKRKPRLKSDDVVQCARKIVLAQLDHGVGAFPRAGIQESHGLERSVGHGQGPARRHRFDGHAALENLWIAFKSVQGCGLGSNQGFIKGEVLILVHGAVQIIRLALAVTGGIESLCGIHGIGLDQRCDRVVEMQYAFAHGICDGLIQVPVRQRSRGKDTRPLRDGAHLFADYTDEGVVFQGLGDPLGEAFPIHGQGSTGGHARLVRRPHA